MQCDDKKHDDGNDDDDDADDVYSGSAIDSEAADPRGAAEHQWTAGI